MSGPPPTGAAVITITAEDGTPPAHYLLIVQDAGGDQQQVVRIEVLSTERGTASADDVRKVRETLENSLGRMKWTNAAPNAVWRASVEPQAVIFSLKFSTGGDATTAASDATKVTRLKTINNVQVGSITVTTQNEELVLTIPDGVFPQVLAAAKAGTWP